MAEIYLFEVEPSVSKKETNRKASMSAKELVRKIASEKLSVDAENLVFEKNENGKPHLKDFSEFHFSISHSDKFIAIGIDNKEIGVDIEVVRNVNLKIADRFFSLKEKDYVLENPEYANIRFFEIWTKKEAYIKKNGMTLGALKSAKTENIYTAQLDNIILSVCGDLTREPELIKV